MEPEKINDSNFLDTIICYVLKKNPALIETWKQEIEGLGDPVNNAINAFENTGKEYTKNPTGTLLAKLVWIMKTYLFTPKNRLEGLRAWNDYLMNSSPENDRDIHSANGQQEIMNFILDKGMGIEDIEEMILRNTLRGKGAAKEVNRKILDEAKGKVLEKEKNKFELPKGFSCRIHPDIVEKIYFSMEGRYINTDFHVIN